MRSGLARDCNKEEQSREGFQGWENILYNITMVVTGHYLSKPTECTTPRVNPDVNYGLCLTQ